MPWSNQGGGGSGGGGPWGGGGSGGGGGGGQGGGPPDLEALMRQGQEKLRGLIPGGIGSSRGIIIVLLAGLVFWGFTTVYRVEPDEQGVILRFGKFVRTVPAGLHFKLPTPLERVLTPKVTRVNREDIGFRSTGGTTGVGARNVPEESLMLTGDENIVEVQFAVFWIIKDAGKFLFNIRNPVQTVKAAAESAMREVIGRSAIQKAGQGSEGSSSAISQKVASGMLIQDILEKGRRDVEQESVKLLQRILDDYGSGIQINQVQMQKVDPPGQVIDAFRDVQRAEADKQRLRNEAEAYRNDILPRARGEAAQFVQRAEGYKRQVVAKAQGETSRFRAIFKEYKKAPKVTRQRLYLETMQEVIKSNPPTIIDSSSGVVPYLPLPELQKRQKGGAR